MKGMPSKIVSFTSLGDSGAIVALDTNGNFWRGRVVSGCGVWETRLIWDGIIKEEYGTAT